MSCQRSVRTFFLTTGMVVIVALILAVATRSATANTHSASDSDASALDSASTAEKNVTQGALRIIGKDGSIVECPLKHTDVKADVTGFIARVNVTQTFHNPTEDTIEAVYVFPLPHEAAVDDMTMVLGERMIVGLIKRRDEARRIYEQALNQGRTAALLEQERPNIFTQSVGNIRPGQEVEIRISYVDVLKYDMGEYEFHFPMVVGPRFIPGKPVSSPQETADELKGKVSPPVVNTTRVPDAERISPPVLKPGMRNGHDIDLTISLDAGVPIQNLTVTNHKAAWNEPIDSKATVKLSPADSVPNKDFVLRYDVVGAKPAMAMLAHTGTYSPDTGKLGTGYFMLMVQPKEDERLTKSPPREMVFLVDVSGSMRGDKTAKTRETMQHMLGLCRDIDTVQVITFASQAHQLFEHPLPVGEGSIRRALDFTSGMRGGGGTRMLQGVKLAIDAPIDSKRLRIIVMLTDGFIGNEAEIIQHVGKQCGDQIRFWAIGIGQSPNMFLVDGVAKQGGGMGKRLGLNDEAESLSHEVMTRIQRAQLANIQIDWGGLNVSETYPTRLPELWAGRPVILFGRYDGGGGQRIHVSGTVEGEPVRWPLTVELPAAEPQHDVLAKVWARRRIEELMHQTFYAGSPAVEEEVTAIALDYRLMSQYTSFVAVDESEADAVPSARPPRRMLVPVPLPEGADWSGFFGGMSEFDGVQVDALALSRGKSSAVASRPDNGPSVIFGLSSNDGRGSLGGGGFGGGEGYSAGKPVVRTGGAASMGWARQKLSFEMPMSASGTLRTPALGVVESRRRLSNRATTDAFGRSLHRLDSLAALPSQARETSYGAVALQAHAGGLLTAVQAAMKEAKEAEEAGDKTAARLALLRVVFLDQAAANLQQSPGQTALEALAALEVIHETRVAAWTKQLPALGHRLDLVIRDQSIAQSLARISKAADLKIELVAGSIDDVSKLNGYRPRVSYLDLRGATVAQALDWVLQPERLTWRMEDGAIVAGADRRIATLACWVYDVASMAFPSAKELDSMEGQDKILVAMKTAAEELMSVVRGELEVDDQVSVSWFAPGKMLVIGSPNRHTRAATLLAKFSELNPKKPLMGEAGKLQLKTADRAHQRKEVEAKRSALRNQVHIAQQHETFGWQVLASAAQGRVDDEALTQLKIAWTDPASMQLLEGPRRDWVLRSLWMVVEASKALPDNQALASLAKSALAQTKPLVPAILEEGEKSVSENFVTLLYLALAMRDDERVQGKALGLLSRAPEDKSYVRQAGYLAESLLKGPGRQDPAALVDLAKKGVQGEDMVALLAMACHRAGGEAWQTFRAESRDILGKQALRGHVVLLVHHLPENGLPLARRVR